MFNCPICNKERKETNKTCGSQSCKNKMRWSTEEGRNSFLKSIQSQEYKEKMSISIKKRYENAENKRKTSNASKKMHQSFSKEKKYEIRKKQSESRKKLFNDPEFYKKFLEKQKDPDYLMKKSCYMKKRWQNEEYYKKMSEMSKKLWQDPKWAKEQLAKIAFGNQQVSPNKAEQKLLTILNQFKKVFFKFVGDGDLIIKGLCPDFVFDNKLVELYGDYWHKNETEDDINKRINHFKNEGYDCLIIWESELKNETELVEKIKKFLGE